jgi:acetamidase/formamidase
MSASVARSIHVGQAQSHFGWSRDHPPVVSVASGSEVTLETRDASGGQLTRQSDATAIAGLDFDRVNPVTGPIFVEGARAGDVLQIDLLAVEPSGWGWTGQIPGFGLLADRFPQAWIHTWALDGPRTSFRPGISVPVEPFCGVIGVAPAEPGVHSVIPPRRVGGNMDIKQMGPGTTLYLPVEVEGALLGVGDTHAAQGDGEVCGTAIEAPMTVTMRVAVRRDLAVDTPQFDVRRPLERATAAAAGYHATTGIAPDLMAATRQSIEGMIAYLGDRHSLSPQEAYALCSVAVDLKISEVVDAPNWIVSAFLPKDLFDEEGMNR